MQFRIPGVGAGMEQRQLQGLEDLVPALGKAIKYDPAPKRIGVP